MNYLISVFTLFFLLSCGQQTVTQKSDPTDGSKQLSLVMFGAPWCEYCKTKFPTINEGLNAELTAKDARVKAILYVETGQSKLKPATQEEADGYRDLLKLTATAVAEQHLSGRKWKKYQEVFPGQDQLLPAAVLYDEKGTVLKLFPATPAIEPQEIISAVKERLK